MYHIQISKNYKPTLSSADDGMTQEYVYFSTRLGHCEDGVGRGGQHYFPVQATCFGLRQLMVLTLSTALEHLMCKVVPQ